eukprot:3678475-Pleurochrysis_carterae.AAC.1
MHARAASACARALLSGSCLRPFLHALLRTRMQECIKSPLHCAVMESLARCVVSVTVQCVIVIASVKCGRLQPRPLECSGKEN